MSKKKSSETEHSAENPKMNDQNYQQMVLPLEAFEDKEDPDEETDEHFAMGHEEDDDDDDDDFDLDDENSAEDIEETRETYTVSAAKMASHQIPASLKGLECKMVTFTTMPSGRSVVCEILDLTGQVFMGAAKAIEPEKPFDVEQAQKLAADKALAQLRDTE